MYRLQLEPATPAGTERGGTPAPGLNSRAAAGERRGVAVGERRGAAGAKAAVGPGVGDRQGQRLKTGLGSDTKGQGQ